MMLKPPEMEAHSGFWRRIEIHPAPGRVDAGLEDDFHRFFLHIDHDGQVVTGVRAEAERYPWSTCAGATDFLEARFEGQSLAALSALNAREHCTHLYDLAIVCAARAGDAAVVLIDMFVTDRVGDLAVATLRENGREMMRWEVEGTLLVGPADWAGKDLRQLSSWGKSLGPTDALHAMMLRRAVFVSNGRKPENQQVLARASDRGPARMGACFTYQMPRAEDARPMTGSRVDFSRSDRRPLEDFSGQVGISDSE